MSRSRTRARNRRARLELIRAEFDRKRDDPEALAHLLSRLADSDICIWPIARLADVDRPLDEAERAMIAQTVAPRLAGMAPGSVRRRHEFSRRSGSATEHEEASSGRVSSLTPEG
jgi:hypothetical protein